MHAPGVGVAVALRRQQVAIRRRGIDACQHGRGTVKDLVVQADTNAGQVLLPVDDARLPRDRLEHVVDAAQADGHTQQVAQELDDAAIRAAADQRQPDDHLAQPGLGHRQIEQHLVVRRGRREGVIQRRDSLVRLLVDELTAHPVPGGEITDRLRTGQRLNGQVLTVTPGQPRRCANTSIHLAPHLKEPGCHHPSWRRQPGCACNPSLNHAPKPEHAHVRAEGGAQRPPFPPADALRRLPAAPAPSQSGSVCVQVASA